MTTELIIDLFAGGGGTSTGIELALGRSPDVAVNHDPIAVKMHTANHPETRHYCESVWEVDPLQVCSGQPVGLLWLSPDCKHFSKAKGGKPVDKRIRGLAGVALRWGRLPLPLAPRVIVLENVEEFQTWGPVVKGRPCPKRKGADFRKFVRRLRKCGYRVQWRELRACDYGAPTIRRRLFLIARRDGQPIVWPVATHGDPRNASVQAGELQPWHTAAECIDWTIPCPSIFTRKKELADATCRRIARGIMRYVVEAKEPFLVRYHGERHTGECRAADLAEPLPTQTTENRFGLVAPVLARTAHGEQDATGKRRGHGDHDVAAPLPTVTASPEFALAAPVLTNVANSKTTGRGPNAWTPEEPLRTITAAPGFAVVAPHLVVNTTGHAGAPMDGPMPTIPTGGHHALVAPLLAPLTHQDAQRGQPADQPLPTITGAHRGEQALIAPILTEHANASHPRCMDPAEPLRTVCAETKGGHHALIAPTLVQTGYGEREGQAPRAPGLDKPLGTAVAGGSKHALVSAFLAKHYGGVVGSDAEAPIGTVTSVDHHSLVAAHLTEFHGGATGRPCDEPAGTVTANSYIKRPGGAAPVGLVAAHVQRDFGTSTGQQADTPLNTITAGAGGGHAALVESFLIKYYGAKAGQDQPTGEPTHTITAKARLGLVTIHGAEYLITDIGLRMLQPRELFAAQGFPPTYKIGDKASDGFWLTKTDQVRMVGNSVCPPIAAALIAANVPELAVMPLTAAGGAQ